MNETSELGEFYRFLGDKLKNGGASLLPEEALDQWRQLHPEPWDGEDDVTAIQTAIDDFNNGDRGVPLDEFMREMSKKLKFPDPFMPLANL